MSSAISAPSAPAYRFGRFELKPLQRQLLADGAPLRIGPHAFDLLTALVERGGDLVSNDELRARIWPRVVVEPNTLQVHISALRKALGGQAIANVSARGYRLTLPVQRAGAGKLPAAATPRHNLPYPITSFIGRESELADLQGLLGTSRLLTLTGAGGCGKTRLATQLAAQALQGFDGGAWMVELAALTDGGSIPQSAATVLGLKEQTDKGLAQTIAEHIAQRPVLLLLDNAEHLLAACAEFADSVLRRCGKLVVLVTSREPLGITGELTYRVPSLSVPDEQADSSPQAIAAYESARLFIDRARLQEPQFCITETNAAALASVCRRLDGIALAIELAAPSVRSMSMDELSGRLDERFALLARGSRTALPRHQTLRSLIDWSFEPLSDAQKTLLCRVSVFSGGWTLAAADEVCRESEAPVPAQAQTQATLHLLTSLVDKSLVLAQAAPDGTTRYATLETIREYAREQLRDGGEESAVKSAHLSHFIAFADKANEELSGPNQLNALDRFDTEHDNMRTALSFAAATSDAPRAMQLAGSMWRFWMARGYLSQGRALLAEQLALPCEPPAPAQRARCLVGAAMMALAAGDLATALRCSEESLATRRLIGDRIGIAGSLGVLGSVLSRKGESSAARSCHEESLAIYRELGGANVSTQLSHFGVFLQRAGDLERARELHEEAIVLQRARGDRKGQGGTLMNLADIAMNSGALAKAHELYEEAVKIFQELGNQRMVARATTALATVMCDEGDTPGAQAHFQRSLVVSLELDDLLNVCDGLYGLGDAFSKRDPRRAATLWGAGQVLRESVDSGVIPILEQARDDALFARARAALGDDAEFDRAWSEGRSMETRQAVEYALNT